MTPMQAGGNVPSLREGEMRVVFEDRFTEIVEI